MRTPKRLIETVPDGSVLSRDEAKSLIDRIVKMSKAESVQVNIGGGYSANVRFADNHLVYALTWVALAALCAGAAIVALRR